MTDLKSMRDAFGQALVDVAKKEKKLLALTADLESSTRLSQFRQQFPDRFFQVGVAEQNLMAISAGLAMIGFTPFSCSFASFITGRAWEQIRICIAANNLPVKIVGSHAGLSHPSDGFTAQGTEDLALMTVLPNMTVVCPADFNQMKKAVKAVFSYPGPVYLRMTREPLPVFILPQTPFEIAKAQILKKGRDITIISLGSILAEVLKAAKGLSGQGIETEIINLHTLKPIDSETIVNSVIKTKCWLTVEDHQLAGGLAAAVSQALYAKRVVCPSANLGLKNTFGKTARKYNQLLKNFGLDSKAIYKQVRIIIGQK